MFNDADKKTHPMLEKRLSVFGGEIDDYLTKPFRPEQIFATLKRVMEKTSVN